MNAWDTKRGREALEYIRKGGLICREEWLGFARDEARKWLEQRRIVCFRDFAGVRPDAWHTAIFYDSNGKIMRIINEHTVDRALVAAILATQPKAVKP